MKLQPVATLTPESIRFSIYMVIGFMSGRRGIRGFTKRRFARIKHEVAAGLAWW